MHTPVPQFNSQMHLPTHPHQQAHFSTSFTYETVPRTRRGGISGILVVSVPLWHRCPSDGTYGPPPCSNIQTLCSESLSKAISNGLSTLSPALYVPCVRVFEARRGVVAFLVRPFFIVAELELSLDRQLAYTAASGGSEAQLHSCTRRGAVASLVRPSSIVAELQHSMAFLDRQLLFAVHSVLRVSARSLSWMNYHTIIR